MSKTTTIKAGVVAHLPLDLVTPDPAQPRKDFDLVALSSLATDIKGRGVQQPITIRENATIPGTYYIVYGERRHRASRMANKETVPCLLYDGEATDEITRLVDQVKENCLRQDLNPMEWSNFFKELHKTHKLKYTEIEKLLATQGINDMGRSYISNISRLSELPAWAQDLIRNNKLTGSHGKYILPALYSPTVMDKLETLLTGDDPWQPNTRELQDEIYDLFSRFHQDLTKEWMVPFNYQTECVKKVGCQKMRKVTGTHNRSGTFCLDNDCFKTKKTKAEAAQNKNNKAAQREQKEREAKPAPIIETDEQGRVDLAAKELYRHRDWLPLENASFNPAKCNGCAHNLPAYDSTENETIQGCFNTACFDIKNTAARTDTDLVISFAKQHITNALSADPDDSINFLLWVIARSPNGVSRETLDTDYCDHDQYWSDEEETTLFDKLQKLDLTTADKFLGSHMVGDLLPQLVEIHVAKTHNKALARLIKSRRITIADYRVNDEYRKQHAPEYASEELDAISSEIKGVPPGIRWAWEKLTTENTQ